MKQYIIEFLMDDNGKLAVKGRNDGFFAHEIVGLLGWKLDDLHRQMRGEIKPDIIAREYVAHENITKPNHNKEAGE